MLQIFHIFKPMFKPYLSLLLFLLVFISNQATAQTGLNTYNHYLIGIDHYSPVQFYTDQKFLSAHQLSDSLDIQIDKAADLQPIIEKGLQNKVYGVNIENFGRPDLAKIFAVLAGFPNLTFIKISDPIFQDAKKPGYQLPANIQLLQQLKGIELFYTQQLNIEDAINKIATLKQLNTIAFTGYKQALPLAANKLSRIKFIKLASVNIENFDVSKAHWQNMILYGSAPFAGPDSKVLATLSTVKSLRDLRIEYYMLGDGSALLQLHQIKTLSFTDCYLNKDIQLFKKIAGLKNITGLSVRFFRDTSQKINGIENLTQLRYLDIMFLPSLEHWPEQLNAIHQLKKLESLRLNSNKLSYLPEIFGGLNKLKKISVAENALVQLPLGIFALPALQYLNAGSNKLTTLPDNITSKNLKSIQLNYNGLISLPVELSHLKKLENLDVSANKISTIPGDWHYLQHLKSVNISRNRLTNFPDGLLQNNSVEALDASDNGISSMQAITGNGYQLKTLNVNNNNITSLPEDIGKYTELTALYACGNRLNALPESLGDCKRIEVIDVHSEIRSSAFDSDKSGMAAFSFSIKDSSKANNIKLLPTGLAYSQHLQNLNLAGNAHINSKNVFDVILNVPRKNFRLNLSNDNITELPADPRWANMTFYDADLSYNKLTTLPVEFAGINIAYQINLNHNLLKSVPLMFTNQPQTKADIQVLYDELGIKLPNNTVSAGDYAQALTKRINDFYYAKKWQKGVEYAQKAIAADSMTYARNIRWDEIGTCRFMIKDYERAIRDFDIYIAQQKVSNFRVMNFITPAVKYKADAELTLNRKIDAAKTYENAGYSFSDNSDLILGALLYKEINNEPKYRQLIDSAISRYKDGIAFQTRQKKVLNDYLLDYAEALLIAEKPEETILLLNRQWTSPFAGNHIAIKNYLLITAQYLTTPSAFEQLKKEAIKNVATNGKVQGWDFTMFNQWVAASGLPANNQQQLLQLQNTVK
jgi:Leucine-rich repeat (LRR) protein